MKSKCTSVGFDWRINVEFAKAQLRKVLSNKGFFKFFLANPDLNLTLTLAMAKIRK